ncbi:MAG: YrzE family protein [Clostridia bacterium]|nr:YrzE family protein [Clostridia bacterium]
MQKLKSINLSGILSIIKCVLLGIVTTLVGIVLFAVVLKFADLSSGVITWINNIIKALSIFIMMSAIKKVNGENLIIKSIVAGALYAVFTFIVFSIMNGSFNFGLGFLYDLLFAVIVSMIVSIILNLLTKKTV